MAETLPTSFVIPVELDKLVFHAQGPFGDGHTKIYRKANKQNEYYIIFEIEGVIVHYSSNGLNKEAFNTAWCMFEQDDIIHVDLLLDPVEKEEYIKKRKAKNSIPFDHDAFQKCHDTIVARFPGAKFSICCFDIIEEIETKKRTDTPLLFIKSNTNWKISRVNMAHFLFTNERGMMVSTTKM